MDYLPPYTGTVLGWAIVVGGGGALYLYYTGGSRRRPVRARANRTISNTNTDAQRSRTERRTTGQGSSSATNSSNATSRPNKSRTESSTKSTKPGSSVTYAPESDEQEDNKAWAKELAKAQQGTTFKSSDASRQQNRQKTVKQASANRVASELSGDSSTAGADADARSPDFSPDLAASRSEAPTSGDVADMLETPEDGPSVLRLTEPERYLPEKQKPAPKAPEQAETKKQRQNKKKAEERKQQQEELERVRKAQLESQRRTAREARGEPAKNGTVSAAAAANAWTQNVPKKETPVVNGNPLLDTFVTDKVTTTDAPSKEAALHPEASQAQTKSTLPSEEEQMRMLRQEEDDSAWKTVGTKKTKSKRKDGEDADDGAVKPVAANVSVPAAGKPLKTNGAYSLLSNDDDEGWTQA